MRDEHVNFVGRYRLDAPPNLAIVQPDGLSRANVTEDVGQRAADLRRGK
jgi:hypothetical protein